jgi:hypothetical protein
MNATGSRRETTRLLLHRKSLRLPYPKHPSEYSGALKRIQQTPALFAIGSTGREFGAVPQDEHAIARALRLHFVNAIDIYDARTMNA